MAGIQTPVFLFPMNVDDYSVRIPSRSCLANCNIPATFYKHKAETLGLLRLLIAVLKEDAGRKQNFHRIKSPQK